MMKKITLLFMLLWVGSMRIGWAADAYKSENSEGVEYTQVPPEGRPAMSIAPPPPPPPASSNAVTTKQENATEQTMSKQEKALQAVTKEEADIKAKNCDQFKKYLADLESKPRIRLIDAEGQVTMLTEEQRNAEIKKAQDGISQNCEQ